MIPRIRGGLSFDSVLLWAFEGCFCHWHKGRWVMAAAWIVCCRVFRTCLFFSLGRRVLGCVVFSPCRCPGFSSGFFCGWHRWVLSCIVQWVGSCLWIDSVGLFCFALVFWRAVLTTHSARLRGLGCHLCRVFAFVFSTLGTDGFWVARIFPLSLVGLWAGLSVWFADLNGLTG